MTAPPAATLASMTGFARTEGIADGLAWAWELRSVNGRGLELRLRLPPGFDALEPALREAAGQHLRRGNVTANLTVKRDDQPRLAPDPAALEQVLALATALAARIPGAPPPRAEALLALPGVLRPPPPRMTAPPAPAKPPSARASPPRWPPWSPPVAARARGSRSRCAGLLDEIAALRAIAGIEAADQPAAQRARMLESVQALLGEVPGLPEERIAQEVALLASRSDVREELDRLDAHLHAADALLAEGTAIGRRFDFLVQEFNREANTLCSKSASVALTATGLKLKAAIEQLREQVQNIE